jgi:uncharacterized iron-regulated membrane protein
MTTAADVTGEVKRWREGQPKRGFLDYRMVWRWHFYAGLFAIPFIIFLSITGSIYLFRPQIESWLDSPYDNLPGAQTALPSRVVGAVLAQNPGWMLHAYQLPKTPHSAAQVLISRKGVERRIYVDRSNLRILKSIGEEERPMRVIFRLHGELLSGNRGSNLVELAASWGIVMIITGLFLWWPRNVSGLGGLLYPRLGRGRRTALRDLHAVTGMWVSIFALGFLLSGLPWANNWGHYLKAVRHMAGAAPASQDWTTGSGEEKQQRAARDAATINAATMDDMPGMAMGGRAMKTTAPDAGGVFYVPAGIDRVMATAAKQNLAPPVTVSPSTRRNGIWTAASQSQDRPLRSVITMNPQTGKVVSRTDFGQLAWIDRLVGFTTAIHEGQFFGPLNQVSNLLLAASLITVSVTAIWMWWTRRSPGLLGAPPFQASSRASWVLLPVVLGLGILLPEFLVSLIVVLLVEWLILRRIPAVRTWLALEPT